MGLASAATPASLPKQPSGNGSGGILAHSCLPAGERRGCCHGVLCAVQRSFQSCSPLLVGSAFDFRSERKGFLASPVS